MNATALLIASDNSNRSDLARHLSETNLFEQIVSLKSAKELFSHLQSRPADLVCWPIREDISKSDWIDKLHGMDQWHDLPLIAFAATDDEQSVVEGFHMGASDCVSFDIQTAELSARLGGHLKRWQRLLELRESKDQLQKMALTDPLTGLGNRATFDMSIKQAAARTQRFGYPYSLLLIDLDHFKNFNDCYGHQAGDKILQKVAKVISDCARDADISCRYGGEEFAVILPDTEGGNAEVLAERIHKRIAKLSRQRRHQRLPVTVSIGISCAEKKSANPARIIEQADRALYRAKENGRNRTEIYSPGFMQMISNKSQPGLR